MKNHIARTKPPAMLTAMSLSIMSSIHRRMLQAIHMAKLLFLHPAKVVKGNNSAAKAKTRCENSDNARRVASSGI